MKKILILAILLLALQPAAGQMNYVFNKGKYPFGERQSQLYHVFRQDTNYYLEGHVLNGWYGNPPEQFKFFIKTDLQGRNQKKVQFEKTLVGLGGRYNNTVIQTRSGLINATEVRDSLWLDPVLMKLNYDLDTVWYKRYSRFLFDSSAYFTGFTDIKETPDHDLVVAGFMSRDGSMAGRYPFLMKVDKQGEIKWLKKYYDESFLGTYFRRLEITPDHGIILLQSNRPTGSIFKTDAKGDIQWSAGIPNDSLYVEEGDMEYMGGSEYIIAVPYMFLYTEDYPYIHTGISLSSIDGETGEVNWHKKHKPFTSISHLTVSQLHKLGDKGFAVTATTEHYKDPDANYSYQNKDHGVFMVFDSEGDSVTQSLLHRNNDSDCWLNYAMIESTGNILGVGFYHGEGAEQGRAWFFKTDSTAAAEYFGDAVPPEYDISMRIYPIPSADQVFFEFTRPISSSIEIRLFSVDGKLALTGTFKPGENLHPINVRSLSSGLYIYRLSGDGADGKHGKIIVN